MKKALALAALLSTFAACGGPEADGAQPLSPSESDAKGGNFCGTTVSCRLTSSSVVYVQPCFSQWDTGMRSLYGYGFYTSAPDVIARIVMESGSNLGSVSTNPNAASGSRSDLYPYFGYKSAGYSTTVTFSITDKGGHACKAFTTY